jgi:hypothetical protein
VRATVEVFEPTFTQAADSVIFFFLLYYWRFITN